MEKLILALPLGKYLGMMFKKGEFKVENISHKYMDYLRGLKTLC